MKDIVTAFGAPWADPARAAAVLRAAASAGGMTPRGADLDELAAAVIGAHALHVVCGAGALSLVPRAGGPAARALGAVLTRAAGGGGTPVADDVAAALLHCPTRSALAPSALLELEHSAAWAQQHTLRPGYALAAAAADLAAGAADPRIAAAVDVLSVLSDELAELAEH